eukprot:jgi/Ulvmu1/12830/UM098_0011.1
MAEANPAAILIPPSTNWYSSAVACTGRTHSACAAYNYVVLYARGCTAVKAVLRAHSNKVTAVAVADSSGHEVVLSGGRDKVAIAWSTERLSVVRKQKLPAEPTALLACPHDHDKAIVALATGSCVVWDWSRGGTTVYEQALPLSPVAILRAIPHADAVLAGCADGSLAAVDTCACRQLWQLPPAPTSGGKPQSGSRSSKGPSAKNSPPPCGIEDVAMTTVPAPPAHTALKRSGGTHAGESALTLLAVSTRAAQVVLFAWQHQPATPAHPQPSSHDRVSDAGAGAAAAQPLEVGSAAAESRHAQQCSTASDPKPLGRPQWLKTLQAPRGSSSATSQVVWTPVCWLPAPPAPASTADERPEAAADQHEGSSVKLSSADRGSSVNDVSQRTAWLLAGLPSGGITLWKVSVSLDRLSACAVAACVGQAPPQAPRPPPPPQHSPGKADSTGSWRPRSAGRATSPADEAAARSTAGEAGGSWRQSGPVAADRCTVQMPDAHARMLFTLHAYWESEVRSAPQWRLVSTSYDRKIVSWLLQLDSVRGTAKLEAEASWHGSASMVSAMCAVPGQPSVFVATADQTIRGFLCHARSVQHADAPCCSPKPPLLALSSRTSSLYHQGFPADVAAIKCRGGLLAAGCADGSVGLMCTALPASKARFGAFASKHAAAVRHCTIRVSGGCASLPTAASAAGDSTSGAADEGSVDGEPAAAGGEQGFVELLTVAQDSRIILWRGLPPLAEVHSMLRSQAGVAKLSTMATPQDVLSQLAVPPGMRLPEAATCACTAGDTVFLGTQQGELAALALPPPGEHSANTTLRAPPPELLLLQQLHGASVTAIATMAAQHTSGAAVRCVIAAAASSGTVALATFDGGVGGAGATLAVLCVLSDVQKSIASLLFAECPAGADVAHVPADETAVAAGDAEAVSGTNGTAEGAQPAHGAERKLLLFASAHSGKVHRWHVRLTQHSADTCKPSANSIPDAGIRNQGLATYCGALGGASGASAPMMLCAVSAPVTPRDSAAHAPTVPRAGGVCPRAGPATCTWVLAGCADRSVRGWPVTAALAEPPPPPRAEPATGQDTPEPPAGAAAAAGVPSEPAGAAGSRAAAEVAWATPSAQEASVACQVPPAIEAVDATLGELQPPEAVWPPLEATALVQQAQAQAGGVSVGAARTRIDSRDMLEAMTSQLERTVLTDAEHDAVAAAHAELEPRASMQAQPSRVVPHPEHAPAASACGLANEGAAAQPAVAADRMGPAAAAVQGVGGSMSRFVGVRASDTARHRPRATALGNGSLLSGYVDERLARLPASHASGLPGANRGTAAAEAALQGAAAADIRVAAAAASSKAGSSARLATLSAAHREALHLLLQGQVTAALDVVVAADALNADFVAMSAAAGPPVWRAVVALHAARLEACGEVHLAVAYHCSAQEYEEAAQAYRRAGLLLEAVALAERHLAPGAALLHSLRQQLAAQLLRAGGGTATLRWRGEVIAAAGDLGEAVGVALEAGQGSEALMHACGMAQAAGAAELAAELGVRAALTARTENGQRVGMRSALEADVGMAAVGAAVGTVGSLLEAWLLAMVHVWGGGPGATLEHAVRAAAAASQRHVELLGMAANSRAALHAVEVGGSPAPASTTVAALAVELVQQAVQAEAVGDAASMHAAAVGDAASMHAAAAGAQPAAFPAGLHVVRSLYVGAGTSPAADAVSLADIEAVVTSFAHAVEHSVRSCLRVSHHVTGSPLQPAAMDMLRGHVLRLLRPLEVGGPLQRSRMLDEEGVGAVHRASGILVAGALARMAGGHADEDSQPLLAEWREFVAARLACVPLLVSAVGDEAGAQADDAGGSIPWVAAIDAFVEAATGDDALRTTAASVEDEGPAGAMEDQDGMPEVRVSEAALQELDSMFGGSVVGHPGADPHLEGAGSLVEGQAAASSHAEHACVEEGQDQAHDKPGRVEKGRKRAARGGGAKEGLSWQEVVSYQEVVQEFGPADWARFRREALAMQSGQGAALQRDAGAAGGGVGEDVTEPGGRAEAGDPLELQMEEEVVQSRASAVEWTRDSDSVLTSWMSALASHAQV